MELARVPIRPPARRGAVVAGAFVLVLVLAIAVSRPRWEASLFRRLPEPVLGWLAARFPNNGTLLLAYGERARTAGRLQEAASVLGQAAMLLPDSPRAASLYSLALADAGDLAAATRAFERAGGATTDEPMVAIFRARRTLAVGDPVSGLDMLRPLLARSPPDAEAWYVAGLCHLELHNTREAAAALDRAGRLQPHWAAVYRDAAQVQHRVGALEQAERLARRALQLTPQEPGASLVLARVLLDRDPEADALREAGSLLEVAAQTGWTRQSALREHGRVKLLQREWSAATWLLREACSLDPRDVSARYYLAHALRHSQPEDYAEALAEFRRVEGEVRTERFLRGAVKEEVRRFAPRQKLAGFYARTGRHAEALGVVRDYLQRVPGDRRAADLARHLEERVSLRAER